ATSSAYALRWLLLQYMHGGERHTRARYPGVPKAGGAANGARGPAADPQRRGGALQGAGQHLHIVELIIRASIGKTLATPTATDDLHTFLKAADALGLRDAEHGEVGGLIP